MCQPAMDRMCLFCLAWARRCLSTSTGIQGGRVTTTMASRPVEVLLSTSDPSCPQVLHVVDSAPEIDVATAVASSLRLVEFCMVAGIAAGARTKHTASRQRNGRAAHTLGLSRTYSFKLCPVCATVSAEERPSQQRAVSAARSSCRDESSS